MTHQASHKFARIAPRKARLVADLIRGMRIDEALNSLEFSKMSAWYLKSVLKSAIANAEEREADLERLYVHKAVDEGRTIKRFRPKDRGVHPIRKRTSHLHIVLEEGN